MFTLGVPEMAVIFILALVLFGPRKLPELGRTIGKAMTEFRRASNDLKATFEREMQSLERENLELQASTREAAREIYDHSTYELPSAESIWNPLQQEPDGHTATPSSTAGASEALSAGLSESADAHAAPATEPAETPVQMAAVEPAPAAAPAIEGTVPRSGA